MSTAMSLDTNPQLCPYCQKRWYKKDITHYCSCGAHSHPACVDNHIEESIAHREAFPTCCECGDRLEINDLLEFPSPLPIDEQTYAVEVMNEHDQVVWNTYRRLDSDYVEQLMAIDKPFALSMMEEVAKRAPWRSLWLQGQIHPARDIDRTLILSRPANWHPLTHDTSQSSLAATSTAMDMTALPQLFPEPDLPIKITHVYTAFTYFKTDNEEEPTWEVKPTIWYLYLIDVPALVAFQNHSHARFLRQHFVDPIMTPDEHLWLQICDISSRNQRLGRLIAGGSSIVLDMGNIDPELWTWDTKINDEDNDLHE